MDKTLKYYISGPMTGLPGFNYDAFAKMHDLLTYQYGIYGIRNPTSIADGNTDKPYTFYIFESIKLILKSNAIILLEGWERSNGARLECLIAKNLKFKFFNHLLEEISPPEIYSYNVPSPESSPLEKEDLDLLEEAKILVSGDRRKSYGSPRKNFTNIAKIWSVVLGTEVKPEQVALCMVGTKLARQSFKSGRDNKVDLIGYILTLDEIENNAD